MATKYKGSPQRPKHVSISCSICAVTFAGDGSAENAPHVTTTTPSSHRIRATALPRIGGLDASFVNIPHYRYPPTDGGLSALERNVHNIESILGEALRSSCEENNSTDGSIRNPSRKETVNGANMQEASRRMDVFLESTMAILAGSNSMKVGGEVLQIFYCQSCLDRIGVAMETCSERLDEEIIAYDKVASSEEERTLLLSKVVSMNSDMDDIHGEEDDAIHRAIESFQYELDTLANACDEQEKELRILQNLMQDQMDRSNAISDQEDTVLQELNTLEIDARNFSEESHLVSNSCSVVENEIDAMSRVKLMSIPFDIRINWENNQQSGRYPTINNLRLAYRINEKAGLRREEINAAFSNAAQLMAFTLGLYPRLITSTIRIIPIHPCAKILVNLPEGQSVHNLGFDTANATDNSNHVPSRSITLFLVLLSQLSAHILMGTDQNTTGTTAQPPFPMTEFSIDDVDMTKLAESNMAAWSSVVFCIAANLRWLSELEIGQSCA
mmetsp:Transcript_24025/g.43093  ORF Transcript_24025/g.43093 Transcript_24025/m.43093 type:complete len:500 (+) Transcript_24025:92-1591(+)